MCLCSPRYPNRKGVSHIDIHGMPGCINVFSHYFKKRNDFRKKVFYIKFVFLFPLQFSSEIFLILRRIRRDSFIHLVVCLTTGPKPLPKRAVHIVRYRASSFKWQYPLLSLRSSNSFQRLLRCLPVTSIPPCIFPSVSTQNVTNPVRLPFTTDTSASAVPRHYTPLEPRNK